VDLADLGSESETCVGSHVRLVVVPLSFVKNFYPLPFTPPISGSPLRSFTPAGQKTVREVGVDVHGGGDALKLVGGGLRPGVLHGGSHGGLADGQMHARRSGEQSL
jgi:hypothetical protein